MQKPLINPFEKAAGYKTPETARACALSRAFPSFCFYPKVVGTVFRAAGLAKNGLYDGERWIQSSLEILSHIEAVGGRVEVEGLQNVDSLSSPCIYVANHMSTLETFLLPSMLRPRGPVTFVVKKELLEYPVFGWVMRSRKPIALGRANPREDLETMLKEGKEKLSGGVSIIVFPQTTRADEFDPSRFNTIGAKLAARSKVPIIPLALKTDFWGNGKKFKDFGPIRPERTVRFSFGQPLLPEGKGDEAHRACVKFISEAVSKWSTGP